MRSALSAVVAAVVVACVAATAHGLYAVALSAGVPWQVAYLYPLITDGLALVAYWSTRYLNLTGYPWLIVIVAAGLSGLAQAVNLAGLGESPTWLRFGVGFWPAPAVLLAAHLYYLTRRSDVPAVVAEEVPALTVVDSPPEGVNGHGVSLTKRAIGAAASFHEENGHWPSENKLAELAGCSRSTARTALAHTKA